MLKKIALASLGCSKNLIDSEHMLAILTEAGYEIVSDEEEADVIIVNTCTFIESAKTESIECILELAQYKKEGGNCKALIVTGCLAQRYEEQVLTEIPEVDAVLGVNEYDKIAEIIKQLDSSERGILRCGNTYVNEDALPRLRLTPSYTAYLKIAEGCDNHCTYCVIPSIRGKYRSRKIEDLVDEAKKMADEGVRELVVIAQDTTRYGIDIYGEYRLPQLLRELCAIDGFDWIRVHYCYPELMTDELIAVFAEEEKLCSYFDIPIQHSCDAVLKRMGRHTNKAQITEVFNKIRREVKDAVIRTTIIVGFPGETEEQFEELCDFVRETRFDRLGVFTYSREEDTPAYNLDGQIDEEEKERRRDVLMLIQSEIAEELTSEKVGTVVRVLVEERDEIIKSWYGRTYADSEEIDGKVFFKSSSDLKGGDFVDVLIEQSMEYDLFGRENV
ncbi:MAG: 30S ribosomal protein S12 methylthiotransferase RimO [Clostridia bacterium]|nr:30S ribosomal protein S12 methylthiotransferase RimO [Clostridia bacterium]